MKPIVEPLCSTSLPVLSGLFLITEDQGAVASVFSEVLQKQGAKTVLLKPESLLHPEQLAQELDQIHQNLGEITGIIHLAALTSDATPLTLSEWRRYTASQSKSLFQIIQHCSRHTDSGEPTLRYVLSTSQLGGYFGRSASIGSGLSSHHPPSLATGGAATGILKTLIQESPGMVAKVIDFDQSLEPTAIAQRLLGELTQGGRVEVGYPQGQRIIFSTVAAPIPEDAAVQLSWQREWVVLVTGGARGITAEIAAHLATWGLTLVVVGRSPDPMPESPETSGVEDISQLRRVLLETTRSQGLPLTPVQIEQQIRTIQQNREIHRNLERFRQAGATVEYISVDVKQVNEFAPVLEGIYQRYGRLDVVIHGAGIIEDKLIIDKTQESFDRVFDTKVDSTFILSQHLHWNSLKALVLFSSVAGRYGNRGQVDYAAANEVMNRLAWQLDQASPTARVVAINWGPWDTTGMASEGIKQKFRERGVIPIPIAEGCQFLLHELRYGRKGEVEVIAGEGPWEAFEQEIAGRQVLNSPSSLPEKTQTWLLSRSPGLKLQPDRTVTLEYPLSLDWDIYLRDHCLDGKPVLPAAMGLELLATFVQEAWPEWTVAQVQDLRVLRGFVLTGNTRTLRLVGRPSTHADATSLSVIAELFDSAEKLPFYRATIILQPELSPAPLITEPFLTQGQQIESAIAYQNYLFHGERFQGLSAITLLNEQGIDAQVQPSSPGTWFNSVSSPLKPWLFDPGLIDIPPQLAIVWARVLHNTTPLPSRLGTVTRYRSSVSPQPLKVAFRVRQFEGYRLMYDATLFDEENNIHILMENIEGICNPHLNRLAGSL